MSEFFTYLKLSAFTGLLAGCTLTFNFLLGIMISTAYVKQDYWKRLPSIFKKFDVLELHNCTAYLALILVFLHPILLLFDPKTKFSLIDIFFPINAPHEKLLVALGTLSMYAIIVVIITTQKVIKRKLGFRTWKKIHLISYATALLFVIHGISIDPKLKDRPVDFIDAEKLVPEGCLLVLIAASVLRYRYYLQNKKKIERF